jgi:hypothetical protein
MAVGSRHGSASLLRAMAILVVAIAAFFPPTATFACSTQPKLHITVGSQFDDLAQRSDFTLQDIQAMARGSGVTDRQVLGFYRGQFGYTIDIMPQNDPECPARIEATVTFRLEHRVIQLGQQVATNTCLRPVAVKHYRRIAAADAEIVERYSAVAALALDRANSSLQQIRQAEADDGRATLRARIAALVEEAIKPLQDARRRVTQAINNSDELGQLASACAV